MEWIKTNFGIDWIIGAVELIGLYIVGSKIKFGFLINIIACLGWIFYVLIQHKTYGLLMVVIPALFINIRNFERWIVEERKLKKEIGTVKSKTLKKYGRYGK